MLRTATDQGDAFMGTTGRQVVGAASGVAALALLALTVGPSGEADRAAAQAGTNVRPNIVLVMTDDQNVEQMAALNQTRALIGGAGTTFANSFSSFPLCCPSRSTMLTGQYPHNHRVLGNKPEERGGYTKLYGGPRPNGRDTLPVWLRRAGYHTTHIGKYLNGYKRTLQPRQPNGWHNWQGSIDPTTYNFRDYCLNQNGNMVWYGKNNRCPKRLPSRFGGRIYQGELYTQKAQAVIRRRAPLQRPFYLSVAYLAPHGGGPTRDRCKGYAKPAPGDVGKFNDAQLPPKDSYDEENVGPEPAHPKRRADKPSAIRNLPRLSNDAKGEILQRFRCRRESLLHVDRGVEAIVNELRAQGELDNTLILFTSDNGFFQGEHRIPGGKIRHYEEGSRVPLLMRGPALGVPRGVFEKQVANIDLAPTIIDAANARGKVTRRLDGRSLLSAVRRPAHRTQQRAAVQPARDLPASICRVDDGGREVDVRHLLLEHPARHAERRAAHQQRHPAALLVVADLAAGNAVLALEEAVV